MPSLSAQIKNKKGKFQEYFEAALGMPLEQAIEKSCVCKVNKNNANLDF